MKKVSAKITVIKARPNDEGLIPIYFQFILNRKVNRFTLNKWIHPEAWVDKSGQFVKEKGEFAPEHARTLNIHLRNLLSTAQEIILNFEKDKQEITFRKFKAALIDNRNQSFLDFCEEELDRRTESQKFSPETIRGNRSRLNKLRKFAPSLSFNDLDVKFLEDYDIYMRTTLGNDINTVYGSMKFIRTMLNAAKKRDLTDVYPFDKYKIVFKKDTRERLSSDELDELQSIYNSFTLPDNLQGVLKYFLFACYTGLTWKDIVTLKYEDIEKKGNTYVIGKKRHKTKMHFVVPLIQKAKNLIDVEQKEGKVFPDMLSNQKSNVYIQRIIKNSKITKHITFHCARHSFATVAMNSGIPREIVQRMLGHATEDQTRLYAKVLDTYIIDEMNKWDKSVNTSNYKDNLNSSILKKYKKVLTQIVAARITSDVSETQIAQLIGVTVAKYSEIEKGNVQLGIADMYAIGEVLDMDISMVF